MAEFGLIVTEEGVSVADSADYQRVIDSRWPTMEIEEEIEIDFSSNMLAGNSEAFYKVSDRINAFPPVTKFYRDPAVNLPTQLQPVDNVEKYTVFATDKGVFAQVKSDLSAFNFRLKGRLRVYATDITKTFVAPVTRISESAGGQSRYGIKSLKGRGYNGSDFQGTDYSKFSIHSRVKAITIQNSGLAYATVANGYTAEFEHNLGYLPTYEAYQLVEYTTQAIAAGGNLDEHSYLYVGEQLIGHKRLAPVVVRAFADTEKINLFGVQAVIQGPYAFVVYKDPLLLKT